VILNTDVTKNADQFSEHLPFKSLSYGQLSGALITITKQAARQIFGDMILSSMLKTIEKTGVFKEKCE
jgi:hypothetical protein